MQLDDLARNEETQAKTRELIDFVDLTEPTEELGLFVMAQAGSGVDDPDRHP